MKFLSVLFLLLLGNALFSQEMNNQKLLEIIEKHADTVAGVPGNWQFLYKETPILCVTDQNNNRMRFVCPITESKNLDKDLLLDSLTANFHSALDVKYAISNGILWSAYVHPLKELSDTQVESAISQVYLAAKTFGTTFTSTELIFGGGNATQKQEEKLAPKTQKF